MANADHLSIVKQGAEVWNAWRLKEIEKDSLGRRVIAHSHHYGRRNFLIPLLRKADLSGADLSGANLADCEFTEVDLRGQT